ncbi:MAG: gliding motility protein GldN [Bacteroidales bacterium]|jgi:gliding motility associated protien GldN|nr:gliding motility protein GldN [Bacteroidales bacterium]
MKKVTLALAIMFCCGFISTGFAQVMEDDSESEQWVNFYDDVHKGKFKPFEFPFVRKADIVNQKRIWRVIDFREKQNQFFYYPLEPTQGRVNLYYVLDQAALEGLIKVYEDDDCTQEIDWATKKQNLGSSKLITKFVWDSIDEMEKEVNEEIRSEVKPEDIQKLRIKEDWFVDKQRTVRDVRIFSFALVLEQSDGKNPLPIFWVHYDDPEVRQLLANTEVYNPRNDAMRMSYDDMFIKRRFSSYIMQETNVYTRRISDYLTGEDMLWESARIEDDLLNMDEDMWEY